MGKNPNNNDYWKANQEMFFSGKQGQSEVWVSVVD